MGVVCLVCVSVCAGSNSHTQEEALFPLSNDNRACVAMATGCAFYGLCVSLCVCVCVCAMFIVCLCSLFAWGVAQHQNCYYSVFSLRCFSLLLLCNSENLQHFLSFFLSVFPLHLFPSTFLVFLSVILCGFEPALTSRATSNPEPHCLRFRFLRLN